MTQIDYDERIPNNVQLGDDRRLKRALEHWQPAYINWWREMGPEGLQENNVYLRTAISVDTTGWAHYDYVRMPEYRWGIFLSPSVEGRAIGFGEHCGQPVWHEVPGEYRGALRRMIVVQGDTEPASIEQQRYLGQTCPSLYDLRGLLQVNVEEGRHLWAMVYLLHAYFGRDGRNEAQTLLERRSGDVDRPRILGAFNERTTDWLAFFMFTYFTDRDGKFQLAALSESAFDPLARTCRFMLKEESYHMYVGETGLTRIIQRSAEIMQANPGKEPRTLGIIDLPTFQRYLNFHYSVTIDLFGSEVSTNAANSYTSGLKGRYNEHRVEDDHLLTQSTYPVLQWVNGALVETKVPALNALNERLRDDFIEDVSVGVRKWNKILKDHGIDFNLTLPHRAFNREIGDFRDLHITPDGQVISPEGWKRRKSEWIPSESDHAYVRSLMEKPVLEPGQFAHWIAPPSRGIHKEPMDFQYVRFN